MRYLYQYIWLALLVVLAASAPARAQDDIIAISGTVHDKSNQEPLPGVSISIKNSSVGILSDAAGNFALKARMKLPFTLVFNMIGFDSKEFEIDLGRRSAH